MLMSWSVWVPFSEDFSFVIDLPEFRLYVLLLKLRWSLSTQWLSKIIHPAAVGFSVSFSSVWEDQALPPRAEITFPLSSQAFYFLFRQILAGGAKCEKVHPLPCQRGRFFASKRVYPGCPATVVWLTCGRVGGVVVGRPSYLHGVVGTTEGHDAVFYLNIILKWEEWINVPWGTVGWSADVSICSCPSWKW